MAKKIVVCIDGTNNAPTTGRTNVSRFFRMLDKSTPGQIAYYQPGVGTLDPDLEKGWFSRTRAFARRVWDLTTGWMIRRHVLSAYRHLMAVHEPGDEIHLVGFSRGAYTVRILAGMLHKVGLLHRGQEEMLLYAWKIFTPLRNFEEAARFKKYYSRDVEVAFLGIWDTVRSVGTPWRPKVFPSTFNNDDVRIVRHAMSLDERRALYQPYAWKTDSTNRTDVLQVWFPGVHADVGGGYLGDEHPGLGAIPLAWMVREAKAAGLVFDRSQEERLLRRRGSATPKKLDVEDVTREYLGEAQHDEIAAHWYWRLLERVPFPRWRHEDDDRFVRVWAANRSRARTVPRGTSIHFSVVLRAESDALDPRYEPESLPPEARAPGSHRVVR